MGKLMFGNGEDNGPLQIRVAVAMMTVSILGVALRFISKRVVGQSFGWDDWMVLLSLPCSWGVSVAEILAVKYGNLGKHAVLVTEGGTLTPTNIQFFFKALYASQIAYTVSIALSKFSITIFYRRIFQVKRTNLSLMGLEGFLALRFVASIIVVICSCLPIYTFWTQEDHGNCVDSSSYLLATAITNVAGDLVILVFPVPIVWNLKMFRAQKISILAFFLLGGFIVLVSCLRLVAVVQQTGDKDFTWAFLPLAVWTTIETNVAIFCACIPSMRPLLRVLQNKFSSSEENITEIQAPRVHKRWWPSLRTSSISKPNANFEMLGESLEFGSPSGPLTTITATRMEPEDFEMPKQGIQVEREITWA